MAEEHQVRTGFVGIQPKLLQPAPEPLKFNFGQFFAHSSLTIPKPERKKQSNADSDLSGRGMTPKPAEYYTCGYTGFDLVLLELYN